MTDHATETSRNASRDVLGHLAVERGRTRFPARPFHGDRFSIGSSESCDLTLGGREVPALCAVIVVDEHGTPRVESRSASIRVAVNGRVGHSLPLEPGDRLEIGGFAFVVQPTSKPAVARSAAELVDDLERDLALVRADEGARALLRAVEDRRARIESEEWHSLQTLIDSLEQRLEHHTASLAEHEAILGQVVHDVLDRQRELESRLEVVLDRVLGASSDNADHERRAA